MDVCQSTTLKQVLIMNEEHHFGQLLAQVTCHSPFSILKLIHAAYAEPRKPFPEVVKGYLAELESWKALGQSNEATDFYLERINKGLKS